MLNEELDKLYDDTIKKVTRIITIILFVVVIILCFRECKHNEESASFAELQRTLDSKVETWKDKEGYYIGRISVLELKNSENFIDLHLKDSLLVQLQLLVKENASKIKKGGSASIISTEGSISVTVPTTVVSTSDCNPIYKSELNLKDKFKKTWVYGTISAKKDSTDVQLKYKEELEVVIGRDKTGFLGLGRGKPYAEVKLLNPYSEVKDMKVYQTAPASTKYFHIGPGIFYGLGSSFIPQVFVGAGIMWTPLSF